MKNLSRSRIDNALVAFAALASGAILAQSTGSGSGCPSSIPGTYCCAYSNGVVAGTGTSTSSANACCTDCLGKAGQAGYSLINISGKAVYCRVIHFNAGAYPFTTTDQKGKTCVFTSPCSFTCI